MPNCRSYWGAAIPGISMQAKELPDIPGLLKLDNPGLGEGVKFGRFYSIEEAALCHLQTLKKLSDSLETPFTLIGMSMGGMILSVLASRYREQLPRDCRFRFLVTSPNLRELPALPWSYIGRWARALPITPKSIERLVAPYFGESYRKGNETFLQEYYRQLAYERTQSIPSLVCQIHALRRFRGLEYFSKINPTECVFVGGRADVVLGPSHSQQLRELVPAATHHELPGIGHMIHLEAPHVFHKELLFK